MIAKTVALEERVHFLHIPCNLLCDSYEDVHRNAFTLEHLRIVEDLREASLS